MIALMIQALLSAKITLKPRIGIPTQKPDTPDTWGNPSDDITQPDIPVTQCKLKPEILRSL
jgi:hypothetical protein